MTLLEFFRLTRHNLVLLVALMFLGGALGAAYAATRPSVYQSTAFGVVAAGNAASVGGVMTGSSIAQDRATAYISLMDTTAVKDRIANNPKIKANPSAAFGSTTATVVGSTSMIRVIASAGTAEDSILLANAALEALRDEAMSLEKLNPDDSGKQIDDSQVIVKIVPYQQASGAGRLDTSMWPIAVGAGIISGIVLGYAIAFIRKQLDVRIRNVKDVEEMTNHSVLGIIPDSKELGKQRAGEDDSAVDLGPAGEALRQLRTNLRYVQVDKPPRAIVITSANPGEGKSTVSSNLARLIARSGQKCVIVDADLRRPVQHRIFGVENVVGLTQVLAGSAKVEDALVETSPGLMVLPSGRVPPNPSELLGSRRMRELIDELAEEHFVILDAPPILSVTDPGLVAAACDGAIVVVRVGSTYKDQLGVSMKALKQVGAQMLGTVMHRAPRKAMGEVVYGAGYAGKYSSYYGTYTSTASKLDMDTDTEVAVPIVDDLAGRAEPPRRLAAE